MATVQENLSIWTARDWKDHGEQWSNGWGTSTHLWFGTLMPRIHPYLPAAHILEIAPGFGRITQFLAQHSQRLTIADLTPKCIDACKQRFAHHNHIDYHVNDGRTLPFLADASVDFALSWDSLVHVEAPDLESYIRELARVLKPGATAFIHHSNLGAFPAGSVEKPNLRAPSVSAALVRDACLRAALWCVTQELLPWGGAQMIDCVSLIRRPADARIGQTVTVEHKNFLQESGNLKRISLAYPRTAHGKPGE